MLLFYKQRKCNITLPEDGHTSLRIETQEIRSSGTDLLIINREFQEATTIGGKKNALQ
jgi:hypothetical protein